MEKNNEEFYAKLHALHQLTTEFTEITQDNKEVNRLHEILSEHLYQDQSGTENVGGMPQLDLNDTVSQRGSM